jgi:hydrogenase expression/formation protein HypC
MKVVSAETGYAICERAEERAKINMMLVGDVPVGTWVLTFQGSAMRTMTEEDAKQTLDALTAVSYAMGGDASQIDALFPDLAGREPPLPEHLKKLVH